MERKPDGDAITEYLDDVSSRLKRGSGNDNRSRWLDYLFHVTDIGAAVSAITDGMLLSRRAVLTSGRMGFDTAAPDIIGRTVDHVQDRVRLYFRPLTPTFWHSEGIRANRDLSPLGSHCPFPVAFLFDARVLMLSVGTSWSDGNASSDGVRIGSDLESLRSLPMEAIYSEGPTAGFAASALKFHRCAEVHVQSPLALVETLRAIFVRSPAEYETLWSLLRDHGDSVQSYFAQRIRVNTKSGIFYKRWTYVDHVSLLADHLHFSFNGSTESPGPFHSEIKFTSLPTGDVEHQETVADFTADGSFWVPLPVSFSNRPFRCQLLLDGHLAYRNSFHLPFGHTLIGGK